MARQMGPVYILGTIGGITFYKSGNDYLARRKGGPTKKQFLKSAAFERARENSSEFGNCSKAGKFLRRRLGNLLSVSDPFCYQRMTQLMSQIKNSDRESIRGQRKVSIGLKTPEGKERLYKFAFNAESPLQNILSKPPLINSKQEILIQSKELLFPPGANHALISGARLHMNLDKESCIATGYTEHYLCLNDTENCLKLKPLQTETPEGNVFYFLQIQFYTMAHGTLVPFEKGKKDSLACIAVDPVLPEEVKPIAPEGVALSFVIGPEKRTKIFAGLTETIPIVIDAPG